MSDFTSPPTTASIDDAQREFVRLFSRHQRQIHAYIGTVLANPVDVEEVLQETSVVLWSKFDTFDRERSFVKWACGIAHLQLLRFFRTHRRRMLPLEDHVIEMLLADRERLEEELSPRRGALGECLQQLRTKDRALIEACYRPGAKVVRVAEELGRSVDSLYHTLGRIRRTLLECIERRTAHEARP